MADCLLKYVGFPNLVHAGTPPLGAPFLVEFEHIGKTECPACRASVQVFQRTEKSVVSQGRLHALEAVLQAARDLTRLDFGDYDWRFDALREAIRAADAATGDPS